MLTRWGRFVHHHPYPTLLLSGLVLAISIFFLVRGGELKDPRSLNLESGHANDVINKEFPKPAGAGGSSFSLLFTSSTLKTTSPAFQKAMADALAPLKADPGVVGIDTPFSGTVPNSQNLMSPDRSTALATVTLKGAVGQTRKSFAGLRSKVHSDTLRVLAYGGVATGNAFDQYLAEDLSRAEVISIPATILLLLLVFGALVAAGLPLVIGVVSILGGIGGIYLLAALGADVSNYAQNVVTLIGLGVSIDYSLFIVNRFREELAAGASREDALATTLGTAGRAISFSGLTVAIGLSGMLFYPGSFLPSMGQAGAIVVAVAVFYSLTLLPALLRLLGPRVNSVRIPVAATGSRGMWHALAMGVMRRPVLVLVPTVAFVVIAGIPFAHLRMANGDIDQLPASAEVRQADTIARQEFPGRDQTTIVVVDQFPGTPLTADRVAAVYDQSRRLAQVKGVSSVGSVVNVDPKLGKADYQRMYTAPAAALPVPVQTALKSAVGPHVTLLQVHTAELPESDGARAILRAIRAEGPVADGQVLVTGQTAFDVDIVNFIVDRTPGAVAFIVVVTALVLFLLLGSVLLPLKAVVMNFLSLSASFGALVWIFQDGHLSGLLGFSPTSIDPSIPVLLFCIVFGLSMDYEVLLMSRMKEEWDRTHDNRHAVAEGLELSGRLVTGAAAIMVVVFLGFGLAQVLLIKSLGLGMAIAVAIDATIVRALIVPATMRLLGDRNWWAPAPLVRLHDRLGLGERPPAPRGEPDPV